MPQPQPQKQKGADPVTVDPQHYTVEAENERVRVLRARYGPRSRSVMHYHPGDSVAVVLTDTRCRFTYPDGTTEDHDLRAGMSMILPAGEHLPENLTDKPFEVVVVELKS